MSVFLTGKYKVFENGNEIVPSSPQVQFCVEGSNDQYDCVNGYNNLTTKSTTYKTNTNLGIAINPGLSVKYKFIDGQRSSTDYSVKNTTGSTVTNPQTQDYNNFTPTDYNLDFFLTSAPVTELPEICQDCDISQFNWLEDFDLNGGEPDNSLSVTDIMGFGNDCNIPSGQADECVEILNWMAALITEEGAPCGSSTYVPCEGPVNYVSIEESSGCCPIPYQELTFTCEDKGLVTCWDESCAATEGDCPVQTCEDKGLVTCWDESCAASEGDCPIDTSGFKELNTNILNSGDVYVTMVTANDNHTFQTIGNQYFDPYTADIVSIIGSGDGSFNTVSGWAGSLFTFESYDGSTHQGITDTTYLINVKDEPVNLNVYLNDFGSSRLDYWEPPTPTISVTDTGYNSFSLEYYGKRPQVALGPRYFIFEICNSDYSECEVREDVQDYLSDIDPENEFGSDPTGNCTTYGDDGECTTTIPSRILIIDGLESETLYNYNARHEMRYGGGVGTIVGDITYGSFTTSSPPEGDVLPPTNIQWDESYTTSTSVRLTWEWTE
jgi:hypothetical protein